jgi:indolepyruvate ferredoxin oxidoreductase beta subunit
MPSSASPVVNVVFAGLGGQGVIKASDVLADAAFRAGHDVKKAEIHGMSQRGGSVTSDVRYGPQVHSPMIPAGHADFLVVLAQSQVENNVHQLRPAGVLFPPDLVPEAALRNKRSLNVALLGALSTHLSIAEEHWRAAIQGALPEHLLQVNLEAFEAGRAAERARSPGKGRHAAP